LKATNLWRHNLTQIKKIYFNFFNPSKKPLAPVNTSNKQNIVSKGCNILIVIENMSYTYDTRVQNISKTLNKAGYHVNVLCPRYLGDPKKVSIDGIDINFYYLPSLPSGFLGYLMEYTYSILIIFILSLATHIRQRVDIFHICNPPDFFSPMGKFFQLLKSRIIYDKHDRVPELFQQRFGHNRPLIYRFLRKAENLTEKISDHIITTNESVKKNVIARNKVSAQKVTVVRNGPDTQKFPKDIFLQSDDELIKVGYVGNMNPQDCIDLLLESIQFIKFVGERTNMRFLLIGNGSTFEDLKKLSQTLKIDDIVEFTGRLEPAKAYHRLAAMHICVQPDRKNSFTNSCTMVKDLEYMALAKPIVAFDLNETRYSCGESALYATKNSYKEFAKQILVLADAPDLRRKMGQLGRKRLDERFTWTKSEKPLLEAYESVTKLNT
jgi:glycosyltransferase involved in cell wall biosynthesis